MLLFLAATAMAGVGIGFSSVSATILGAGVMLALAWDAALTAPLGRRVRRERLEFAWWLDRGSSTHGTLVPGVPIQVRCFVRHRGAADLRLTDVRPLVPEGVDVEPSPRGDLPVTAGSRTEFTVRVGALAAGRVVLHGLAVSIRGPLGLFAMPLYFPNPLVVRVLPRPAAMRRVGPPRTGYAASRAGRAQLRRRGGGTDFHELRHFQSGDPFKSIAWKASARAGRLLIKEVEQEVQEAHAIVVDVTGSMRDGAPGARKLDHAIEACAALVGRAIREGDRVGLVMADERPLVHVPVDEGTAHVPKLYDAMLAATEVVDADLTSLADEEVGELVAKYVRHQDGLDFGPGRERRYASLSRHVHRTLDREAFEQHVQATTAEGRILRAFCRSRGIPLPHRPPCAPDAKARSLAAALQLAVGRERAPRSIVLITDFEDVRDPGALRRSVRLLRAHGHALSVLVLSREPGEGPAATILSHRAARAHREARTYFGALGVPVVAATGKNATTALSRGRALERRRVS